MASEVLDLITVFQTFWKEQISSPKGSIWQTLLVKEQHGVPLQVLAQSYLKIFHFIQAGIRLNPKSSPRYGYYTVGSYYDPCQAAQGGTDKVQ